MTWFQLVDAQRDDFEPRQPPRLVPNSALFLNPALPREGAVRSKATGRRHLRLVKGSRVGTTGVLSAA